MKFVLLLCVAGVVAFSGPAWAATASHPAHPAPGKTALKTTTTKPKPAPIKVAPADEYFGHQKISILGVNNTIHDTNLHIGFDQAHAAKYYGQLAPAEDALMDWARKYPQDTWLPGRAYYMSHVFWQMHSPEGDLAAEQCRTLLFKQFPHSHWAVLARAETKERIAPVVTAAATTTTTTTVAGGAPVGNGAAAAANPPPAQPGTSQKPKN